MLKKNVHASRLCKTKIENNNSINVVSLIADRYDSV